MRKYKVESYDELPDEAQIVHDIGKGMMQLYAPPELMNISRLSILTIHKRSPQDAVRPNTLHQAFRYGISITQENAVVGELQNILAWIGEQLQ